MFLKKGLILAISCVTLVSFYGCTSRVLYKSTWQNTPITIDGRTDDWKMPVMYTDENTKLDYYFSNDSNYLYLFIETEDDAAVSGITQRGFQVWIDTMGTKNHEVGILCPMPRQNAYASSSDARQKKYSNSGYVRKQPINGADADSAREKQLHSQFRESVKKMHVSGFKTVPNGELDNPNAAGINLGICWTNSNALVYEAAIPLKSFLRYPLLPSDSLRPMGISFSFTTMPQQNNSAIMPGFGAMGFRGGFGMMGGGMSGGVPPEPEAQVIWLPMHLCTKPVKHTGN